MRMRNLCVLVFVVACGGGKGGGTGSSGVDANKAVSELTSSEITKICTHLVPLAPDPGTVTCPDGDREIGETTVAECEDGIAGEQAGFASCGITAGEYESCVEALFDRSDEEICDDVFPPECDELIACSSDTPPPDEPPPEPPPGG